MKRVIPLLVIAAAVAAFMLRGYWLPAAPGQNAWLGSVEARLTLVAPVTTGRLTQVVVQKGASIKAGEILFKQDDANAQAQAAQADAAVNTASDNLQDLLTGKRPDEIAVIDQQLVEAQANLDLSRRNYLREAAFVGKGIKSQADFDAAKAALSVAEARVNQFEASRKSAALPARDAAISSARSRIVEAQAAAAQSRAKLSDVEVRAPADARVDDVFFSTGEVVNAGQPVVALLTPDATVLRFFVPETARARLQTGIVLAFRCDGCSSALTARISHIFAQPEYTPPVIYSENSRGKLVFQVEAKIDGEHPELQPGLPVQVDPLP